MRRKSLARENIYSYVAPGLKLFPTEYALVFGTRHGLETFAAQTSFLFRAGYFRRIIVSGGVTAEGQPSEAQQLCRTLLDCRVPKDALIVEDKSRHTGENVMLSRSLMRTASIEELFLIGKLSSKRRYLMTVRKQWPEIRRMCCYGVNYFSCDETVWWTDREFRSRVISEYRKIPYYLERGFIVEISIADGIVLDRDASDK
jgi:uncharacterized SAM-binding protein YcdF (DUF218 family)